MDQPGSRDDLTQFHLRSAGKSGDYSGLYDGRLDIEPTKMGELDRYYIENIEVFQGGFVESRQCSWSRPIEAIYRTSPRCYLLHMSLSTVVGGTARNLSGSGKPEHVGRMWLVPPEQSMQIVFPNEGVARSIRCLLDAELFEPFLQNSPSWRGNEDAIREAFHLSGGQIEWLLRRMHRELHDPDFATGPIVESLAKQLAGEIVRKFKLRDATPGFRSGGLAPWRMQLIRQRLLEDQPLPKLEELATLCDMTVRHLTRAFRSESGQTLGRHVETAMVERATAMLTRGRPVIQVATSLGYSTSGTFAAAFRRATGMLPSEVQDNAGERVRSKATERYDA
jgi:AraC family transcriptional regulator